VVRQSVQEALRQPVSWQMIHLMLLLLLEKTMTILADPEENVMKLKLPTLLPASAGKLRLRAAAAPAAAASQFVIE
jgi:hypothetical protein